MKIDDSTSWPPEVAFLKICAGTDNVTGCLGGYSRLLAVRQLFLNAINAPGATKTPMPVESKMANDRIHVLLSAIKKNFKSDDWKTLELHPIVWYWFCKKEAPQAICPSFTKAIRALEAKGCSNGVLTVIQLKNLDGTWSEPNFRRAEATKDLNAGVTIARLANRKFQPLIAIGFWKIYRPKRSTHPNAGTSPKLEQALIESLGKLRQYGLKKQIDVMKRDSEKKVLKFSTAVFLKLDITELIRCTETGNELLDGYAPSTIDRALSSVIKIDFRKSNPSQKALAEEAKKILLSELSKIK